MKITTKTTKEEMTKYLGGLASKVQKADKGLYDRMNYTSKAYKKDPESVSKKDLADLVKEVDALLTPAPKAENSLKKSTPLKKGAKKSEQVEDESSEAEEETVPEEKKTAKVDPKKSANKTKAEKPAKKSGVTALKSSNEEKAIQLADTFKDEIEVDGVTYDIAHDIKTMDDLYSALENEEVIVFAMYWSKRLLKQFKYFNGLVESPKEFPLDLDLSTCIYASDNGTVAYAVSMYTEACYALLPENLIEEDGLRYSGGVEFQIYRQRDEE